MPFIPVSGLPVHRRARRGVPGRVEAGQEDHEAQRRGSLGLPGQSGGREVVT